MSSLCMQILDVQFKDIDYPNPQTWSQIHLFGVSEQGKSVCLQLPFGADVLLKVPEFSGTENVAALMRMVDCSGVLGKPKFKTMWPHRPWTRTKTRVAVLSFRSARCCDNFTRKLSGMSWPLTNPVKGNHQELIQVFESSRHVSPREKFCSRVAGGGAIIDVSGVRFGNGRGYTTNEWYYLPSKDGEDVLSNIKVIEASTEPRHLRLVYSIETSSRLPTLSDEKTTDIPPRVLMISYIVTDERLGGGKVTTHKGLLSWRPVAPIADVRVECFETELAMLIRFEQIVRWEFDADVIVCHDGAGFAMNYISQRARCLGNNSLMNMGKYIGGKPQQVIERLGRRDAKFMGSPGRIQFDTHYSQASKDLLHRGLSELAKAVLPENHPHRSLSRVCTDHEGAWRMFASQDGASDLAASCLSQALTTHSVFDEIGTLNSCAAQARITFTPMQTSILAGRQAQLMTLLLSSMHKEGVFLSIPADETLEDMHSLWADKIDYAGGKVLETKMAVFDEPVCVLDFERMYPSLQQIQNICPSTVIPVASLSPADKKFIAESKTFAKMSLEGFGRPEWKDIVICQDPKRGFMPRAQERLWQLRTQYKKLQTDCDQKDKKRMGVLRACEIEAKVAANALYGLQGLHIGAKMSNPFAAAALTQFGRMALAAVCGMVKEVDKDLLVVFGDTDSIALWKPRSCYPLECFDSVTEEAEKMRSHILEAGARLTLLCNEKIGSLLGCNPMSRGSLTLAIDKCLHPSIISDKKKRYLGLSWPGGELLKKGGAISSHATAKHLRETLDHLAEVALKIRGPNCRAECLKISRKACLEVAMGKIPPLELSRAQDINRSEAELAKKSGGRPSESMRVARHKRRRGLWTGTFRGDRVHFVHTIGEDGEKEVEDAEYADAHRNECIIDKKFYLEHYATGLEGLLAPLGISAEDVLADALLIMPETEQPRAKRRKMLPSLSLDNWLVK